jgi:hypothetical protein
MFWVCRFKHYQRFYYESLFFCITAINFTTYLSVIDAIKAAFDGNPLYPDVLSVSNSCCPMRAE